MPRFPAFVLAGLVTLAFGFVCAPSAAAQLDLPRPKKGTGTPPAEAGKLPRTDPAGKPRSSGRGVVPHLVCVNCGEHNYHSSFDRPTPDGFYTAHCFTCGRDKKHKRSEEAARDERIDLPTSDRPSTLPPGPTRPGEGGAGSSGQAPRRYGEGAAAFIMQQIVEKPNANSSVGKQAVESLLSLGEEGLTVSRIALHDNQGAVVTVAGRVLIRSGGAEDAERLVQRLRNPMPDNSGVILLDEFLQSDPVHASPAFLVELLDHPKLPMRAAALRHLRARMDPEVLALLTPALASKRTETRLRALQLAVTVDDPAVVDMLLDHLSDRSARVAAFVVSALAGREDQRVELELMARAFSSRWILRENAYAILALIEIEDVQLRPVFDERHVEALLGGLQSSDLLVNGSCATALAGIGFRSRTPDATAWLDRDVAGRLVGAVSGKEYHSDFSALQPSALRRLRLISGEDFGTDGPAWAEWWIANRGIFYAHRAYLGVPEGGEGLLEVNYRATGSEAVAFSLIGSKVDRQQADVRLGIVESFLITDRECRDLIALMEREGVLGPERIPGLRGKKGSGERTIEVLVGARGKEFTFGPRQTKPWFERLTAALHDLSHRNRWQRFPDLTRYESERAFWEVESGWWTGEHTEQERALRLKQLIFASIHEMPPSRRNYAYNELTNLYQLEGVADREDFSVLLDLLRDEGFFAERARQLVELALEAAKLPEPRDGAIVDAELCDDLLLLLLARFSQDAMPAMGRVASACGREFVRQLAADERPLLRAVAAAELSVAPDERDGAILIGLLEDPEKVVEAAAALALGSGGVEAARTELLLRARLADPLVRSAALKAVGKLGGDYVLEALVLGGSDPDPMVQRGAAEGLAELGDPQSAQLLISLLRRGRESEIFETARDALRKLGEQAKPDLLRVVNSPAHPVRLEAALLVAYLGAPEVVPAMIDLLDDKPDDATLGFELAVLTCVDYRGEDDPPESWAKWFDQVTHTDSLVWLVAAMERRGTSALPVAEFKSPGTREAALFLLEVMASSEDFLAERGRRELARMLARELGEMPRSGEERNLWLSTLRESVLQHFDS